LFGLAAALGFGAYKFLNSASSTPSSHPPSSLPPPPVPKGNTHKVIPPAITQKLLENLSQPIYRSGYEDIFTNPLPQLCQQLDEVFKAYSVRDFYQDWSGLASYTASGITLKLWATMRQISCSSKPIDVIEEMWPQTLNHAFLYLIMLKETDHDTVIQMWSELMTVYKSTLGSSDAQKVPFTNLSKHMLRLGFMQHHANITNHDSYALHKDLIRFIVLFDMPQSEIQACGAIADLNRNVFCINSDAWLYIAGLGHNTPLRSAIQTHVASWDEPQVHIIDIIADAMMATPDLQTIAKNCLRFANWDSYKADFLGFLGAINPGYPNRFNQALLSNVSASDISKVTT
jgi:hypothetical protein